jgi:hypothetical protein
MSEDELNRWLAQLAPVRGWTVYQVGDGAPPPLVAICHRHYFTDVVIIHDARTAVAYRTLLCTDDPPPDASEALWTYSGDADSAIAEIFALSRVPAAIIPMPSPFRLPAGELRDITGHEGDRSP